MLQLTRKPGETIIIGDDIRVSVIQIAGGAVRIGIDAPRSVPIYREEIWEAVRSENAAAASAAASARLLEGLSAAARRRAE